MSRLATIILGCLLGLVVGCNASPEQDLITDTVEPAPTINLVFSTPKSLLAEDSLPNTPRPTLVPLPTLTPVPTIQTRIVTIYGDGLNDNWSVENSKEVVYELEDTSFAFDGANSLSYKPKAEYADLAFTLNKDADEFYLRDEVLAVRFWVYGDGDYIETDDLLVTVVGSNDYPYWVAGDDSVVVQDSGPIFPETRLYFINVEEDIPPDTWFQVELWLNDLIYDPEYEYVTGVYLKSDADVARTLYLDEVELLIREN